METVACALRRDSGEGAKYAYLNFLAVDCYLKLNLMVQEFLLRLYLCDIYVYTNMIELSIQRGRYAGSPPRTISEIDPFPVCSVGKISYDLQFVGYKPLPMKLTYKLIKRDTTKNFSLRNRIHVNMSTLFEISGVSMQPLQHSLLFAVVLASVQAFIYCSAFSVLNGPAAVAVPRRAV